MRPGRGQNRNLEELPDLPVPESKMRDARGKVGKKRLQRRSSSSALPNGFPANWRLSELRSRLLAASR